MYRLPRLAIIEVSAGAFSIAIGLAGFFLAIPQLELLGLIGTVFAFGVLVARTFRE